MRVGGETISPVALRVKGMEMFPARHTEDCVQKDCEEQRQYTVHSDSA